MDIVGSDNVNKKIPFQYLSTILPVTPMPSVSHYGPTVYLSTPATGHSHNRSKASIMTTEFPRMTTVPIGIR